MAVLGAGGLAVGKHLFNTRLANGLVSTQTLRMPFLSVCLQGGQRLSFESPVLDPSTCSQREVCCMKCWDHPACMHCCPAGQPLLIAAWHGRSCVAYGWLRY